MKSLRVCHTVQHLLASAQSSSQLLLTLEAFDGGGTVSEKKIIGKKWFVERVLGENPTKIATDKVTTTAVET